MGSLGPGVPRGPPGNRSRPGKVLPTGVRLCPLPPSAHQPCSSWGPVLPSSSSLKDSDVGEPSQGHPKVNQAAAEVSSANFPLPTNETDSRALGPARAPLWGGSLLRLHGQAVPNALGCPGTAGSLGVGAAPWVWAQRGG